MKKIFVALLCFTSFLIAQNDVSSIASQTGAFSRMGFGARGKGMANALTSVTTGNMVSYYNPALSVFQEGNSFNTSYSFLSLDRSLNFLNFTKKIELGKKNPDGTLRDKPRSVAGISVGIINSGVGNFDERDNQGLKTGTLSPFENQFFLGFGMRVSEKVAIGVSAKFYYSKLYDEITSTSIGFDVGAVYILNPNITVGAAIVDLNSKYKWDTTKLYEQEGTNTIEKFPLIKKIAVTYKFDNLPIIASAEIEAINSDTNFLRFGAEYNIFENLFLRGGLDQINISNSDFPIRPSIGFSYLYNYGSMIAGIDYAFVTEPYTTQDQHIVGVNFNF